MKLVKIFYIYMADIHKLNYYIIVMKGWVYEQLYLWTTSSAISGLAQVLIIIWLYFCLFSVY